MIERHSHRPVAAAAAVALLLAACSGDDTSPSEAMTQETPVEALPSPTVEAGRWASIEDMAAVLEDSGIEITGSGGVPGDHATLKDFKAFETPQGNFDIYLFRNSKNRDLWLPQMRGELEVVYGPNWVVVPFTHTAAILAALGGEVAGPSDDS